MLLISLIGSMMGVSMGIFIGGIGKMKEGVKVGVLLAVSMTGSFLAGLRSADMKYLGGRNLPVVDRLNPAAVATGALYRINGCDDPGRLLSV